MALTTITISVDAAKGGTTQAPVTMSTSPPSTPANGSLWFNTETGRLYVYYTDGTSDQWVEI